MNQLFDPIKALEAISSTMKKCGEPLTETPRMLLAGSLAAIASPLDLTKKA
jgi:hypothetical protein